MLKIGSMYKAESSPLWRLGLSFHVMKVGASTQAQVKPSFSSQRVWIWLEGIIPCTQLCASSILVSWFDEVECCKISWPPKFTVGLPCVCSYLIYPKLYLTDLRCWWIQLPSIICIDPECFMIFLTGEHVLCTQININSRASILKLKVRPQPLHRKADIFEIEPCAI